jgi:hypothetical protein
MNVVFGAYEKLSREILYFNNIYYQDNGEFEATQIGKDTYLMVSLRIFEKSK